MRVLANTRLLIAVLSANIALQRNTIAGSQNNGSRIDYCLSVELWVLITKRDSPSELNQHSTQLNNEAVIADSLQNKHGGFAAAEREQWQHDIRPFFFH